MVSRVSEGDFEGEEGPGLADEERGPANSLEGLSRPGNWGGGGRESDERF